MLRRQAEHVPRVHVGTVVQQGLHSSRVARSGSLVNAHRLLPPLDCCQSYLSCVRGQVSGFASTRLLLTTIQLSVSASGPERHFRAQEPQNVLFFRLFAHLTPRRLHRATIRPLGGSVPIAWSFAFRLQLTTMQTTSTCIVTLANPSIARAAIRGISSARQTCARWADACANFPDQPAPAPAN